MIVPNAPQSAADVAGHYDELDAVYRAIWGEHVHHGLWRTGREREALVAFRRGISLCPWDASLWKTYLMAIFRIYTGQLPSPQS